MAEEHGHERSHDDLPHVWAARTWTGTETAKGAEDLDEALRDLDAALTARAEREGGRWLAVAASDAGAGWRSVAAASRLISGDLVDDLARLGEALSDAAGARMLLALLTYGERSEEDLASAGEVPAFDFWSYIERLRQARLVYQPDRGRYRLTSTGQRVALLLFWCAHQTSEAPTAGPESTWFAPEPPKPE